MALTSRSDRRQYVTAGSTMPGGYVTSGMPMGGQQMVLAQPQQQVYYSGGGGGYGYGYGGAMQQPTVMTTMGQPLMGGGGSYGTMVVPSSGGGYAVSQPGVYGGGVGMGMGGGTVISGGGVYPNTGMSTLRGVGEGAAIGAAIGFQNGTGVLRDAAIGGVAGGMQAHRMNHLAYGGGGVLGGRGILSGAPMTTTMGGTTIVPGSTTTGYVAGSPMMGTAGVGLAGGGQQVVVLPPTTTTGVASYPVM